MPIKICKIEWALLNCADSLYTRHQQKDFEIIWILQGNGVHIVNNENYHIKDNMVYAALPGHWHALHVQPDTKGYIISFDSSKISKHTDEYAMSDEAYLHQYFSKSPFLSLPDEEAKQMLNLILLLETETYNHLIVKNDIACKYFQIFQLYLRRHIEKNTAAYDGERNSALLQNFLLLVENNFRKMRLVNDYAIELHVTPNYLTHVIKKESGHSASHLIQQRVMQEAKRKARHSDASMKEVAYELGFTDIAHFSRYFKNMSGMNFSDFKRQAVLS